VNATYKHIVLLTDGISEEGDSLSLAKEAEAQKVTISTVGLGQDVNRSYLERIATSAGGKSYFLTEPQGWSNCCCAMCWSIPDRPRWSVRSNPK